MNINYLKNSKEIVADTATIQNLNITGSLTGVINLPPSSIQTNPPNSLTVNEISKLIGTQGNIVDTNTQNQTIQSQKIFNSGVLTNISTGYYSVRNDTTPEFFNHTISYDVPTNGMLVCTSYNPSINTSFVVGFKELNNKESATNKKMQIGYLSTPNTTYMNFEDEEFLRMSTNIIRNRFDLVNLNKISFGSNLSDGAVINITKPTRADINISSSGDVASLKINGTSSEIEIGPSYKIITNNTNPELFNIRRDSNTTFFNYNNSSGCTSIGDNLSSSGLNYGILNIAVPNKILKLPHLNASQQNTFLMQLSDNRYSGSLYFNSQFNRLCYLDGNNILHQLAGTIALSGNDLDVKIESPNNSAKTATLLVDDGQNTGNNNIYAPFSGDVHLKHLENVSSNIQSQLNNRVTLNGNENITGQKTFESASNNSNTIVLKDSLGSINGVSFVNQFSPSTCRILKHNDDLRFIVTDAQKMSIRPNGNLNLDTGRYLINEIDIKDVGETLTNKTINFSNNTLAGNLNIISPNKLQQDGQDVHKKYNNTTTSPTISSDTTQGYQEGSLWYNSTTKSRYICNDASATAAVWKNTNVRTLSHIPYTTSTLLTYEPWMFFFADQYYYSKLAINSYSDGSIKIEIYNISTSSAVNEETTISAGNHTTIITVGSAVKFAQTDVIRLSIKVLTGTVATVFCTSTS